MGWYVKERGGGEFSQGKRDAYFGGIFLLSTDHRSGVGGVAYNIQGVQQGEGVQTREKDQ